MRAALVVAFLRCASPLLATGACVATPEPTPPSHPANPQAAPAPAPAAPRVFERFPLLPEPVAPPPGAQGHGAGGHGARGHGAHDVEGADAGAPSTGPDAGAGGHEHHHRAPPEHGSP